MNRRIEIQKDEILVKREPFREAILSWSSLNLRDYPWRKTGRSPYEILIAELLLKRTTSAAAAHLYDYFLSKFTNIGDIMDAHDEELAEVLSRIGLQRQRARSLKLLASYLRSAFNNNVPCKLNELLAVPGLGEYSARAVLSFGFNIASAVVDSNVERILFRVFNRMLSRGYSRHMIQEIADILVPVDSHREFNFGILDLGALVCKYRAPICGKCTLASICDYHRCADGDKKQGQPSTAIGVEIRRLRKEKGVSLSSLAATAGISKLTIIRIESGKASPRRETVTKIANALHMDSVQLVKLTQN